MECKRLKQGGFGAKVLIAVMICAVVFVLNLILPTRLQLPLLTRPRAIHHIISIIIDFIAVIFAAWIFSKIIKVGKLPIMSILITAILAVIAKKLFEITCIDFLLETLQKVNRELIIKNVIPYTHITYATIISSAFSFVCYMIIALFIIMPMTKRGEDYISSLCIALTIIGLIMICAGICLFLIGGFQALDTGDMAYGSCYKCDGLGKYNKNGIIVSCSVCNGTGIGAYRESGANELLLPAIGLVATGAVLYVVRVLTFLNKKKEKKVN